MGRPAGGKNRKLTAEEKETIVLEYLNGRAGYKTVARAHDISESLFYRWIEKYQKDGIEGLRSKTGKHANPNAGKYERHPSEIDKLKRELLTDYTAAMAHKTVRFIEQMIYELVQDKYEEKQLYNF